MYPNLALNFHIVMDILELLSLLALRLYVLVIFHIAVARYLTKVTYGKKGLFWLILEGYNLLWQKRPRPSCPRSHGGRRVRKLAKWHPVKKQREVNAGTQPVAPHFLQLRTPMMDRTTDT